MSGTRERVRVYFRRQHNWLPIDRMGISVLPNNMLDVTVAAAGTKRDCPR
jgi:hypothetical protein